MNEQTNPAKPVLKAVPEEQRDAGRQRTLKGGDIVCEGHELPLPCTIRDLSDTGAKLRIETARRLPESFLLQMHDGRKWLAEVIWQTGENIGVRFVAGGDAAPDDEDRGELKKSLIRQVLEIERRLADLRNDIMNNLKG